MKFSTLLVVSALLACVGVQAQAPIPYRPDGYQVAGPLEAPIQMDMFVDLLCPDCAGAWPNIQQVIAYYGQNLSLAMHTFPLPYHTYAFTAAQGGHVILDALQAEFAAVPEKTQVSQSFFTFMFENQQQFWNGAVANSTSTEVLEQLTELVVKADFITEQAFTAGMQDDNLNQETRVSWKYACSRGVLGTPTFLVNGVNVNGDPSWQLSDWRQVLDPLLQPQPPMKKKTDCKLRPFTSRTFTTQVGTCPAGEPQCNYSPGKFECCFPGEECIPNVGCRC